MARRRRDSSGSDRSDTRRRSRKRSRSFSHSSDSSRDVAPRRRRRSRSPSYERGGPSGGDYPRQHPGYDYPGGGRSGPGGGYHPSSSSSSGGSGGRRGYGGGGHPHHHPQHQQQQHSHHGRPHGNNGGGRRRGGHNHHGGHHGPGSHHAPMPGQQGSGPQGQGGHHHQHHHHHPMQHHHRQQGGGPMGGGGRGMGRGAAIAGMQQQFAMQGGFGRGAPGIGIMGHHPGAGKPFAGAGITTAGAGIGMASGPGSNPAMRFGAFASRLGPPQVHGTLGMNAEVPNDVLAQNTALLTKRQFAEAKYPVKIAATISEATITEQYAEYKEAHTAVHARDFFDQFSKQPWFKEKYSIPARVEDSRNQGRHAKPSANEFWEKLEEFAADLDNDAPEEERGVGVTADADDDNGGNAVSGAGEAAAAASAAASSSSSFPNDDGEDGEDGEVKDETNNNNAVIQELSSPAMFSGIRIPPGTDPKVAARRHVAQCTLFMSASSPLISRRALEDFFASAPGFVSLSLTEPLPRRSFGRMAWARYDSPDSARHALNALRGTRIAITDGANDPSSASMALLSNMDAGDNAASGDGDASNVKPTSSTKLVSGPVPADGGEFFEPHVKLNRIDPTPMDLRRLRRVTPVTLSDPERVKHDAIAAAKLADALDKERGIPEDSRFSTKCTEEAASLVKSAIETKRRGGSVGGGMDNDDGKDDKSNNGEDDEMTIAIEKARLEIAIAYLRRVHHFCYYSGLGAANGDELTKRHGEVFLRGRHAKAEAGVEEGEAPTGGEVADEEGEVDKNEDSESKKEGEAEGEGNGEDKDEDEGMKEGDKDEKMDNNDDNGDDNNSNKNDDNEAKKIEGDAAMSEESAKKKGDSAIKPIEAPAHPARNAFERGLDERIAFRIHLAEECANPPVPAVTDAPPDEFFRPYVIRLENGRVRCAECSKLFVGESFVRKHVLTRHDTRTESEKAAAKEKQRAMWFDEHMFETYKMDPRRIMHAPAPMARPATLVPAAQAAQAARTNAATINYVDLDAPPPETAAPINYRAVISYDDLGI